MKKSLSILLLLALCLFVSGTFAENDKIVVGLIQQDLTHPFHLGEVEGAKVAAENMVLS